ncbi:YHYH domain-containing protein [Agathobaculum sp.]|uniref:YHYH domain-containing protein n=1 Tax=Agathobaculum sp. TaxID=2048138 RepID=UPI0027B981B3|nr:YHYH domain-containing protein [Agathobaculum sp.]
MKKTITAILCFILVFVSASAHSGRTDANGGHWDSSTAEYHYHHGYPAHQHTNGVCPYDYDDQTGATSGSPSSGSSSNAVAVTTTDSNSAEDSSTGYKYNNGAGDDGTYETAYNLGYQHGMGAAAPYDSGYPDNISAAATYFCHTKALIGSTSYADSDSSYDQAYEDGYLAATSDMDEYISIIYPNGIPTDSEEISSLEYPYDRDDGTYETAYNAGYAKGCAELIELNSDVLPDVSMMTGKLSEANRIEGNTLLEDHGATFESAYEDGYYQSETDFYSALNDLIMTGVSSDETNEIYDTAYKQGVSDTQKEYNYVLPVLCVLLIVVILTFIYYRNKANNTRS